MRSFNGWQRIGVVLSASWFLLVTATFGAICGQSLAETDFAALWSVETAVAQAQRSSSPPASSESFKGFFDEAIAARDRARAPSATPRDSIPDGPPQGSGARAATGMFDDLIPQTSPPLQSEPQRASTANPYDRLPDIATGSVKSTTGAYDDLIPKGLSLKDLQAIALLYSFVTAAPIALLWALGYTIAWIVAGFRMDRREALVSPRGRIEPELSARANEGPAQRLD